MSIEKQLSVRLLILLISTSFLLTACNDTTPNIESDKKVTTITMSCGNDKTGALKTLITEFENQNPNIRVKFVDISGTSDDLYNIYASSLSGGSKKVDVYVLDNNFIKSFAKNNYLWEIEKINDDSTYLSIFKDKLDYEGKNYGVPFYANVGWVYYRKDLIKTFPNSFSEINDISKNLSLTDNISSKAVVSVSDSESMVSSLIECVLNLGVDLGIDEFVDLHNISKDSDVLREFKYGRAAFMRNESIAWRIINQDDSIVRGKTSANIISNDNRVFSTGASITINKESQNYNEALCLVNFLGSQYAQKLISVEGGFMPSIKSLYEDERILEANPHFKLLADKEYITWKLENNFIGQVRSIHTGINDYIQNKITKDELKEKISQILPYIAK